MKVIGGTLKGRNLFFLKNKNIRPTKDIVREAVFDVLMGCVEGQKVLDLFAGTGSLGIEAASRGAEEVVFVESDYEAAKVIKKNLEQLSIAGICSIIRKNAEKALKDLEDAEFGLILADPPYEYKGKRIADMMSSFAQYRIVKKGGIIVVEHERKNKIPAAEGFNFYKQKDYGRSCVSYFRY